MGHVLVNCLIKQCYQRLSPELTVPTINSSLWLPFAEATKGNSLIIV